MSDTEMSEHRECGADAAAYALGALELEEAEAFRAHLRQCAICQDEVATFAAVADSLAMAAPQHPASRRLRKRVMRAARAEPSGQGEPAPAARTAARRDSARRRLPTTWLSRPGLAAAAAGVIVVAILVGSELSGPSGGPGRLIQASVIGSPGSAQLHVSGDRGELVVQDFPAPPAGHIYEVWLQRGAGAPIPTSALFSVTAKGAGDVEVPGDLRGVSQVMVTPEPTGGSRVPTHPPVIIARLD